MWTSLRADSDHSAQDWALSSGEKQGSCSGGPGASGVTPWIQPFRDEPKAEARVSCVCPQRISTCRSAGDASVCVNREGRGWESLGTDVRLIGTPEELMRSHQKWICITLEKKFLLADMPFGVCVCVLQSESHPLKEQEGCYMEAKGYISACPVSQTSSEWPSAAPPSSPSLQERKRSQNEWLKVTITHWPQILNSFDVHLNLKIFFNVHSHPNGDGGSLCLWEVVTYQQMCQTTEQWEKN